MSVDPRKARRAHPRYSGLIYEDEAEIDAHNRAQLWADVINRLEVAHDSLEQAAGALEELRTTYGASGFDLLESHVTTASRNIETMMHAAKTHRPQ